MLPLSYGGAKPLLLWEAALQQNYPNSNVDADLARA